MSLTAREVRRRAAILEGGCECGRNQYVIHVPTTINQHESIPKVQFDGDSWSLRANAPPASVFLRVPLAWLHSTTYAFFPDETPALIRRSYTPRHAPASKRFFCGVCADILSIWSEASESEARYAHVNWHTLELQSRILLDDMGLLPGEEDDKSQEGGGEKAASTSNAQMEGRLDEMGTSPSESVQQIPGSHSTDVDASLALSALIDRDLPWFDAMLEGSALGRIRRRTGGGVSTDGRSRVEWEVVEYGDDEGDPSGEQSSQRLPVKRRWLEADEADDHAMR